MTTEQDKQDRKRFDEALKIPCAMPKVKDCSGVRREFADKLKKEKTK